MRNRRALLIQGQQPVFYFLVFVPFFKKKKKNSIFNSALGVTYLGNENVIGELLNIAFP